MHLRVLYFAVVRERLGRDHEALELPDGATVAALLDELSRRHGAIAALRRHLQVARNQSLVPPEAPLAEGDEVALIPPVSGGAAFVALRDEPIDVGEVVRAVAHAGAGGIVSFVGMVRRESRGKEVERLEYEAYRAMAEASLATIAGDIERSIAGARVAILHRVGTLAVGEVAVVLAASAPHRAEAFQAAREVIERLKKEVPIWKKEVSTDGEEWIGLGP